MSRQKDKLLLLSIRAKALKSESAHTNAFIRELVEALESTAEEHAIVKFLGDLMRKLIDQLTGLIALYTAAKAQSVADAATIAAAKARADQDARAIADAATQARTDAGKIKELQDALKAGTPANPDDTVAPTDPARIEADSILDAAAGTPLLVVIPNPNLDSVTSTPDGFSLAFSGPVSLVPGATTLDGFTINGLPALSVSLVDDTHIAVTIDAAATAAPAPGLAWSLEAQPSQIPTPLAGAVSGTTL